jgi:WD40 repeat protein
MSNDQLVSGSKNIIIWDLSKKSSEQEEEEEEEVEEVTKFVLTNGHRDWICCLEKSPNGHLLSGSRDKLIKIWNMTSRVCIGTLKGHQKSIACLRVFKNEFLISGSDDRTIKIWADFDDEAKHFVERVKSIVKMRANGFCVKTLVGHTDFVLNLEINEESKLLLSCSADETIRAWDLSDIMVTKSVTSSSGKCVQILSGHTDFVCCVKLNATGNRLISGSYDGCIKVWDLATGVCLRTILTDSTIWRIEMCGSSVL